MRPRLYAEAVQYAAEAHNGQVRKGSNTPYIGHPLAVSALVISYGGDEEQAIAALLHDVVEDCGVELLTLQALFGAKVACIVDDCTDGVPDATGRKPAWRERKEAYIASIAGKARDALLVVACDKLHNAEAIAADFQDIGAEVFERFTSGPREVAWYYDSLYLELLKTNALPHGLAQRLRDAVSDVYRAAKVAERRARPARAA